MIGEELRRPARDASDERLFALEEMLRRGAKPKEIPQLPRHRSLGLQREARRAGPDGLAAAEPPRPRACSRPSGSVL